MSRTELERMREAMGENGSASDWVMPGVLLLFGMPLVLLALWMAGSELLFRMGADRTQGVVVERKGDVPQLTVEYRGATGASHRLESAGSDLYKDVEVGHAVGVFVSRANPAEARLAFFTDAWMLPLILGVFGSFFAIPGLFFLRANLRKPNLSRALEQNGRRVQAELVEVEPVLTLAGFRRRLKDRGNIQCTLRKEDGKWQLIVDGQECDPFALNANSDWGIQYRVIASWRDPETGTSHLCESEPVDVVPASCAQFGTVSVLTDPQNPQNYRVDII